jgi:hypothetical protein
MVKLASERGSGVGIIAPLDEGVNVCSLSFQEVSPVVARKHVLTKQLIASYQLHGYSNWKISLPLDTNP